MLQLNYIRQNTELVKQGLALKQFKEVHLVEEILALDAKKKNLQQQSELIQSRANGLSKEIGILIRKGTAEDVAALKKQVEELNQSATPLNKELADVEKTLDDTLVLLPNLPSPLVPTGKTPEDNVIVRQSGDFPSLPEQALPHWDLAKKYKLIDFELGNKVTGNGFPFYTGQGARLQRALIQYFLDFNNAAGYTEYIPPFMVNAESAYGTGQLPDKEGQMYFATADNFYLIPTAEVPLTNIYRDTIIKESDLPVKMTAYTPCFRREAGSYGSDVRGLNRLHQFDKVELVQLVNPDNSYAVLDEMVAHVERLIVSLGLPYRLLRLCGGDMSFASALTYDFEVYSAAQDKWLEVSSVSNFESFQSNRMKIRSRIEGKNQLLHSLNGSSLALPRILAALLENNQENNFIRVPQPVVRYFGAETIGLK